MLLRFHGERRGGGAATHSCVCAGRVIAALLNTGPDVYHGVGDEHGGFDDEMPVDGGKRGDGRDGFGQGANPSFGICGVKNRVFVVLEQLWGGFERWAAIRLPRPLKPIQVRPGIVFCCLCLIM